MSWNNGSPDVVGNELRGKKLKIGNTVATITDCLPRNREDNIAWLETKPLFGEKPVDVYVSPYRGSHLLFIRTKPDTCVRIEGIELKDEQIKGAGRVCKALKIIKERTGNAEYDGETLKIRWHRN